MNISPCNLIQRPDIIDRVVEMMSLSQKDGLERGVIVYKSGGDVLMTDIQKGGTHSISLSAPVFTNIIGAIHTHPNEQYESLFSMEDIEGLIQDDLKFSAAVFDRSGKVMVDVFTGNGIRSLSELDSITNKNGLDLLRELNDLFIECTVEIDLSGCHTCGNT